MIIVIRRTAQQPPGNRAHDTPHGRPFQFASLMLSDQGTPHGSSHAAEHRPSLGMGSRVVGIAGDAEERYQGE